MFSHTDTDTSCHNVLSLRLHFSMIGKWDSYAETVLGIRDILVRSRTSELQIRIQLRIRLHYVLYPAWITIKWYVRMFMHPDLVPDPGPTVDIYYCYFSRLIDPNKTEDY